MKKVFFTCLFLFYGMLFAQNYYEIPYVGTKSKLTKLSESEINSFLQKYKLPRDYLIKEKEDLGFSQNLRIPARLSAIYKEEIPDEKGNYILTAYRLMYVFDDFGMHKSSFKINLDDSNIERCSIGQKIYFIKDGIAEKYFEGVYFGNVIYWGINGNGVSAENLQFKIDSGFIYAFNITLAHYYHDFYMGLDTDRTEEVKFSEFEIYKDKISNVMNKSKFAYIPNLNYLPLIDKNNPFKYSLQNAFDGDISTSYVPKPCDEQIRLSINFDEKNVRQDYEITKIMIVNGYALSEELYQKNNRIKEVRYAYTKDKNPITFVLKETSKKQFIEVCNPRKETYFAFNVLSLYPGDSYNDTCFAEVNIFSKEYGWYFGDENE